MPRRLYGIAVVFGLLLLGGHALAQTQSGSVGIDGRIGAAPPTIGATISRPSNGAVFTETPITVSGLCTGDVLVKIFKNGVFAGSVPCASGSFSLQIDLFSGRNDLVAKVYDALDQSGPDSPTVTVSFNDAASGIPQVSRPSITSEYARRGANPNTTLEWPITLSGGTGPYAISVDWGDGTTTLYSAANPGQLVISHVYKSAGSYRITIKGVDAGGLTAYLQVVGIANGQITQSGSTSQNQTTKIIYIVLWLPLILLAIGVLISFWLGRRFELRLIRTRINSNEDQPLK